MTRKPSDDDSPLESFERIGDQLSRRSFMGDAAKVGGGAFVLSAGSGAAVAGGGDDDDDVSDVDILNFALTLEKLEANFYEGALASSGGEFDESDIENSDVAKEFSGTAVQNGAYQRLEDIRDHERAHVDALTEAIEAAGGDPVSGLTFEFPYESVEEFFGLARTFEDTGAAAYAGAAPMIENPDYVGTAGQILAVEARHAGYLRLLNEQTPFPNAFQETLTMDEVLDAVDPFIQD